MCVHVPVNLAKVNNFRIDKILGLGGGQKYSGNCKTGVSKWTGVFDKIFGRWREMYSAACVR